MQSNRVDTTLIDNYNVWKNKPELVYSEQIKHSVKKTRWGSSVHLIKDFAFLHISIDSDPEFVALKLFQTEPPY